MKKIQLRLNEDLEVLKKQRKGSKVENRRNEKRNLILSLVAVTVAICIAFVLLVFNGYSKYVLVSEIDEVITYKETMIDVAEIVVSPDSWTNGNDTVTISTTKEGGQIYYRINSSGEWRQYSEPVTVTENCTIYARLSYSDGNGPVTAREIENIDKINPTSTAPQAESTTGKITVTCKQSDSDSGISTTQYGILNTTTGNYEWQNSNVFEGLTQGTEYSIKTKVTDRAGNVQESTTTTISTLELNAATLTVKENTTQAKTITASTEINPTNKDWTDKNVKITTTTDHNYVSSTVVVTDPDGTTVTGAQDVYSTSKDGRYTITVTTSDVDGNTRTDTYYIFVDRSAPTVTFNPNGNTTYAKSQSTAVIVYDGLSGVD